MAQIADSNSERATETDDADGASAGRRTRVPDWVITVASVATLLAVWECPDRADRAPGRTVAGRDCREEPGVAAFRRLPLEGHRASQKNECYQGRTEKTQSWHSNAKSLEKQALVRFLLGRT
jgi:hypothetical protein